jgi:hypothetical protein
LKRSPTPHSRFGLSAYGDDLLTTTSSQLSTLHWQYTAYLGYLHLTIGVWLDSCSRSRNKPACNSNMLVSPPISQSDARTDTRSNANMISTVGEMDGRGRRVSILPFNLA